MLINAHRIELNYYSQIDIDSIRCWCFADL